MRRLLLLVLTMPLLTTAPVAGAEPGSAPGAAAPRDTTPAGYSLVWADEFARDGRPNPRSWTYESGFVRNQELQWYQPENAWVEDGLLIIEARRERRPNPAHDPGSDSWRARREHADYTSASLTTRGLHSWRYGRFEMRARIDTRPGLWPAFWTLGVQGRWPANGEIDIMEYYRGMLLANMAWAAGDGRTARWDDVRVPLAELGGPDWPTRLHVWRMDWDEEEIRLYVDDVLLNSASLEETFNEDGVGNNPLRQPHYIILNLAVGGSNGGDPSGTGFPARMEVDYVRVYQRSPTQALPLPEDRER
jgi:beta-glucanase (GH16 family)